MLWYRLEDLNADCFYGAFLLVIYSYQGIELQLWKRVFTLFWNTVNSIVKYIMLQFKIAVFYANI